MLSATLFIFFVLVQGATFVLVWHLATRLVQSSKRAALAEREQGRLRALLEQLEDADETCASDAAFRRVARELQLARWGRRVTELLRDSVSPDA